MNAVLWVRQGKVDLALANISGSMMIQATVPNGIGMLFTSWRFHAPLILAAAVTIFAMPRRPTTSRRARADGRPFADRLAHKTLVRIPTTYEALEDQWEDKGIEFQRLLVEAVLEPVTVKPAATRGRRIFDPSRLVLVPRA